MLKLKDILKELEITPQNISRERVYDYFYYNIYINSNEFHGNNDGWKEYAKLRDKYDNGFNDSPTLIKKLSQSELNKFYKEMRALVRKHVGKERL